MKKFFYCGIAASMLFTASCSNEEQIDDFVTNVPITFSLGVDDGMLTRTAGEELNADRLVYSLFDANGDLVGTLTGATAGMVVKENAFASGAAEDVTLNLVKGQTYTITFWAQNSACEAYSLVAEDGGLKVSVDYNGANNDETRDAFYASETFTVDGDAAIEVVLKRPFAQINLGVSAEDWEAALASGLNITESKVVIKNAATSINLLDGSVSGESAVTYDYATIPSAGSATRTASTGKKLTVNDQDYQWLSMSYILTDETKTTLDSDGLQFVLAADNGQEIVLSEGLHNVPVQRNWRTNVVGDVLTGEIKMSVYVDPIYYSVANVTNVDELYAALKDNNIKVIRLAPGTYDILYVHMKGSKLLESANPVDRAVIKGVFGAAAAVEFNNLDFIASESSNVTTGHQYIDRMERKAIVPIYAAKVKFTNCKFTDLYNSHNVVAINYQAHKAGVMLEVDQCYFQGYAYALYSRALVSVTNSTFSQTHPVADPRAIFLYGLGDGNSGKVIFKNNKAVDKTSYSIQMMSANYDYKKINFDVQNNENFEVGGETFCIKPGLDHTGTTFAEGSATFSF